MENNDFLIVIFLYADTAAAIPKFLILDIVVESKKNNVNKKCVVCTSKVNNYANE